MTIVRDSRAQRDREFEAGQQVGFDEALWQALDAVAACWVGIAAPMWRYGDGQGGAALARIAKAISDAGLSDDEWGLTCPKTVQVLADRDGWECAYCQAMLGYGHPSIRRPQIDHVIPKCQGGSNKLANKVLACQPCNLRKGGRTPEQWRADEASKAPF